MIYVGWIRSHVGDSKFLRDMGVRGPMTLNNKSGIYEHCWCSAETMRKLNKDSNDFNSNVFTELDESDSYFDDKKQFLGVIQ